ncbi:MAG: hypothetical protein HQK52_01780 [Oligoflexia bacterium]|nr:hypothetical protein [Oligoflexia bacterium]
MIQGRSPDALACVVGLVILLLIHTLYRLRKAFQSTRFTLLIVTLLFILSGCLGLQTQIITNIKVEYVHWYQVVIFPGITLFLITIFAILLEYKKSLLTALTALGTGVFLILHTQFIMSNSSRFSIDADYLHALSWIKNNTSSDTVILSPYAPSIAVLYTSRPNYLTFLDFSTHTSALEHIERFFIFRFFMGNSFSSTEQSISNILSIERASGMDFHQQKNSLPQLAHLWSTGYDVDAWNFIMSKNIPKSFVREFLDPIDAIDYITTKYILDLIVLPMNNPVISVLLANTKTFTLVASFNNYVIIRNLKSKNMGRL